MNKSHFQHALYTLLRQPDPEWMLKNSKPIDRSQENAQIISSGEVQKINWIGALPSSIRDRNLHLNFDIHQKMVRNEPRRSSAKIYRTQQKRQKGMSFDFQDQRRIDEENLAYINQHFQHFPKADQDLIQAKVFSDNAYSPKSPNGGKRYFSASINPSGTYRTTHHFRPDTSNDKSDEPKQLSIKYIGVHNDIIGVLTRKIPLFQDTKKRSIKPQSRLKEPIPIIKSNSLNKTAICFSSMNSNQYFHQNIFHKFSLERGKILTDAEQNTQLKDAMNQDSFYKLGKDDRRLSEIKENIEIENKGKITSQEKRIEMSKQQSGKSQNEEETLTGAEGNSKDYQLPLLAPISPFKNDKFKGNRPRTEGNSRSVSFSQNNIEKKQRISFYVSPPKETKESKSLFTNVIKLQDLTLDPSAVEENQEEEEDTSNYKLTTKQKLDFSVPDPMKYDKFVVNKYSIQHKLVALKKPREESPYFQKRKTFLVNQL